MTFVHSINRSVGRGPRRRRGSAGRRRGTVGRRIGERRRGRTRCDRARRRTSPSRSPVRLPPGGAGAGRARRAPRARLAGSDELRAAHIARDRAAGPQGELIGTLYLGPRLSEQDYSRGRPQAPHDPRRAGRAGHPRRPARARAGRGDRGTGAPRAGDARRDAHPAAVPAARAAATCPTGRSRPTTARPARSVATSTTSSRCPTAGSGSSSAT